MRAALRSYAKRSLALRYAPAGVAGPPPALRACAAISTVPTNTTTTNCSGDSAPDEMKGSSSARGGGNIPSGKRPVSEANRISISERLHQFRAGPDDKITFESGLSNHERAVIHELCKKMGLKSKSFGKGDARRITVFKHQADASKDQAGVNSLGFSSEAQSVIQQLFYSYPPTENEGSWKLDDAPATVNKSGKTKRISRHSSKSLMGEEEIKKQVAMLGARFKSMPALQQICEERARLPIAKFKDEIVSTIEKNQVVLIAGETGCGKTTQVPQFILDHLWSQGKYCRIYCTQPRRISASSVAERIATERGEPIGESVGYQIKLETKGGSHSSLMFCTTGVLLRKIINAECDDPLNTLDVTHIVVDEIHERDRDADFLLIALRDFLSAKPDLRLILMSATLDAELFSAYFNNCPVIKVPGFTYPVQSFYLEDVIVATNVVEDSLSPTETSPEVDAVSPLSDEDTAAMDEAISSAWAEDDFQLLKEMLSRSPDPRLYNYQHSLTGATALMVSAGKGKIDEVLLLLSRGADTDLTSKDGANALDWADKYGHLEIKEMLLNHKDKKGYAGFAAKKAELLEKYLSSIDQEEIDTNLIERLLRKICTSTMAGISPDQNGSILIFLPGWDDITRTRECLEASSLFGDPNKLLILPLHSMIPSIEQRKVFQKPKPGVRKIILATNIAETAITINDVVFVIDTGRIKEKSYDPYSNVSTLQTAWISKASARQREGRAGRCRPGVCYHLYSRIRANALPDFQLPEIKRTSLEELCLQVKLLNSNCSIKDFLSKAVDPPNELSVSNAIRLLQDIGALTADERLTELGKQLGALPVHPSTSKMLLLGILLNCLGPALTIACAGGVRDPFMLPTTADQRRRAFAVKRDLASAYGGYSDQLAIVAAFDRWEEAQSRGHERWFCEQNFLSLGTMSMLSATRQQLQRELALKGFIPRVSNPCNLNARDPGIVRALIVASTYPMVGMLLPPLPNGRKAIVQTAQGMKVRIHPHSLNFTLVRSKPQKTEVVNKPLLVFDEITRGEAWMYMRNCTIVKPHPLFLLATEMVVAPCDAEGTDSDGEDMSGDSSDEEGITTTGEEEQLMSNPDNPVTVVVDRWLKFQVSAVEAAQMYCLRERLAAAIAWKLKNPRENLPAVLGHSVFAVACLLSYDGNINLDSSQQSSTFSSGSTYSTKNHEYQMPVHMDTSKAGRGNDPRITSVGSQGGSIKHSQLGQSKGNLSGHYLKRPRANNFY